MFGNKMILSFWVLFQITLMAGMAFAGDLPLKVGDKAPDFQLKDQNGKMRRLQEFRGRKVVLYFYPKDDTPGCTKEACSFRDGFSKLQEAGIVILGISYDSPEKHREFIEKYHLPFDLLSDRDKSVAKMYGAYRGRIALPFPKRITYLVNPDGIIVGIFSKVDVNTAADDVLKAFATAPETR